MLPAKTINRIELKDKILDKPTIMENFERAVFPILFKGSPLLVTPIGDEPTSTYLVDLEEVFIMLEMHSDSDGVIFWKEYGKGVTTLSNNIGRVIEEKNRNAFKIL